jgi:DNA-binding Lrp family transcriptional regulator
LDKTDELILQVLRQDSRAAFVDIAPKVGLSEAAVRRRVSNLVKEGTIKRFTIDVDEPQTATSAITYVSVSPSDPTADVSRKLKSVKGVETIYETTGSFDIGVLKTETTIILRTIR